jgi:hypothetical protein
MPSESELLRRDSECLLEYSRQLIEQSQGLRQAAYEDLSRMNALSTRIEHAHALLKAAAKMQRNRTF